MCFAPQRRATCSSLIWPHGSAPVALASLLSYPRATNDWNTVFRDLPTFSRTCIFFFWLSLLWFDLVSSDFSSLPLPISVFHLSILTELWLLNFLRQINLPIVCPAALAIVAWVRWVNWSVDAELVAATQGNPLQPALSGHFGNRGNTIGNVGEFQVRRRSQVPWELEVLGNHVASAQFRTCIKHCMQCWQNKKVMKIGRSVAPASS